jgi:hypothetical protein
MRNSNGILNLNANLLANNILNYNMKQKIEERTHIKNGENSGSLLAVIFSKRDLIKELKIIPNIHSNCNHLTLNFKIPIQNFKNIMKKIETRVIKMNHLSTQ